MAFEALQDKFSKVIKKLKGQSRLTESNMDEMLKEVRIALLEADVNYKVVKEFINKVKEKALGEKVFDKLNPSEMVIKIVRDELVELLGSDHCEINYNKNKPTIIMLVGLQGSGKTTTLYASLLAMNRDNKNVVTIEDPVEYHIDNVTQVQMNPAVNLTFAAAIKTFLRQDPDIILVGEVRDN